MDILKRIRPYYRHLRPVWLRFALGILFGVLYAASSGLGLPVIAETVFPVLFGSAENAPEWLAWVLENWFGNEVAGGFLVLCCIFIPLVMLLRATGQFGNGYYMNYVGIYVVQAIQQEVFQKIQSLPLSFFQRYKTGELMASINGYPNQIKQVVVNMSNDLVKEPLTLISAVSFLVYKSFTSDSFMAAIIGVISVPFIVFPVRKIGKYLSKRSQQLVSVTEALQSSTIESVQSPIEIRAYNLQARQNRRFSDQLKDVFRLTMKSVRGSLMITPTIEVVAALGLSMALFLGVRSGMNEGEFMALGIALYMAYTPLKKLGKIHGQLRALEAPVDRLEAILNAPETEENFGEAQPLAQRVRGDIAFEDVHFAYANGDPVLKGVSAKIPAGESVGLVGKSGAGKTTFVNLILRLFEPTQGRVLIDGMDVKKIRVDDLRAQIAYVPQIPMLFNMSVADNIRIGRPEASEEHVIEAARQANALEFIESLPEGFYTVLSERGTSLSGGQRQRIAIARAFLKDAPILVLDEATSALDNQSDRFIQEALTRLAKNRTTLIIAHRMNSLEAVNRRLYFEGGAIAGDGSHEELIAKYVGYAQLAVAGSSE